MTEALVRSFLAAGTDLLDHVDRSLVDLESRPGDLPLRRQVTEFCGILHRSGSFLGLHQVAALSAALTSLVEAAAPTDGQAPVDPPVVSVLLQLVDAIRAEMARILPGAG